MAVVTPPPFLDVDSVYGADDLGVLYRDLIGEGVMGYEDLRVRQRGAGANMSVDVGAGTAWIMGDESLQQPRYRVYNDGTVNVAVTAAHATNPRIDMVIAEVRDATFSGAFNDWRLRMVDGTATGGATLDNRTGAAALPNNSILLADVLVPALDTTVNDAEIRDRRPFATPGVVPPLLTKVDMVGFTPHPGLTLSPALQASFTAHDLQQSFHAAYLPRRIVAATRLRFTHLNDATGLTGNYNAGIYDASGRKVVETGSLAFTATANAKVMVSATISATTLEPGWYYVGWGTDTSVGSGSFPGVYVGVATTAVGSSCVNIAVNSVTGGVTLPQTLLAMSDSGSFAAATGRLPVPLMALSVG